MDYVGLKQRTKEQVSAHWMKYVCCYGAVTLISYMGNFAVVSLFDENISEVLTLIATLLFTIIENTMYFLFIKAVRNESFQRGDIRYSLQRIAYHISLGILFGAVKYCITFVIAICSAFFPLLYLPLFFCFMIVYQCGSCFIAYSIYDGCTKPLAVIRGVYQIIRSNVKQLLLYSLKYPLWLIVCAFAIAMVASDMVQLQDGVIDLMKTAEVFFMQGTSRAVISIAGIVFLAYVVSCYIMIHIAMFCANIYEEQKDCFLNDIQIGTDKTNNRRGNTV